jgi:hypothetical protein
MFVQHLPLSERNEIQSKEAGGGKINKIAIKLKYC